MEGPYHLILLSLLFTAAYLFTLLLVKTGILSKPLHRKIWNYLLMISFLGSGILGILLVIRVNYQLEWSFLTPLMTWHVDTGIGLCLIALFHLLRHRAYFLSGIKRDTPSAKEGNASPGYGGERGDAVISAETAAAVPEVPALLILGAGFFATVVQVLLIREITTVFQGNELMMGWTLAIWMFLTGMGTFAGRAPKKGLATPTLIPLFLLLAWLPPLLLILMNGIHHLLFPPGQLIHPLWFLLLVLLLLAPLCLLSGYVYALMVHLSRNREKGFTRIYALEAAGSLIGGIIVTFLLTRWFTIAQALLLTAIVIHILLLIFTRRKHIAASLLVVVAVTLLFFLLPADVTIKSWLLPGHHVVETRETPYGNITVTENGGEYNFFENGNLLFSTGDMVLNEEYVHFAMVQHPNPKNVLLVSGGMAGMTAEILKYPEVSGVDVVELNPDLVRIARDYRREAEDPRVHTIGGDGRRYIQNTGNRYDVVIFTVPDPSSLQINRYYTDGFLRLLKGKLRDDAVVLFGLSSSGNYMTPEKGRIGASLYHTLKKHFSQVIIIPGERDYYLASEAPLTAAIGKTIEKKGITASYVNPDYLDDASLVSRGEGIRVAVSATPLINTDRQPLPVFYHSLQFLSLYAGTPSWMMALPLLLLLLPLLLLTPVSAGMYVTGFTASSVEVMLIFWFQILFGNLYATLGLIFALFMGGLAVGSLAARSRKKSKAMLITGQLLLALYMLLFPLLWRTTELSLSGFLAWLIFLPFLLVPALLTGFLYVATTVNFQGPAPRAAAAVYAADLWGSALGAILVSFIMLPVFGITTTSLILAAVNGGVILLFARKI